MKMHCVLRTVRLLRDMINIKKRANYDILGQIYLNGAN